jgi:hypothetical protein
MIGKQLGEFDKGGIQLIERLDLLINLVLIVKLVSCSVVLDLLP